MDYRRFRLAQNEARFRSTNERIEERTTAVSENPGVQVSFLCECARDECDGWITLALPEYEHVRADPRQFMVVPGHELVDLESVVERHEGYFVVRKRGEAAVVAEQLDDRS